MLRWDEMHRGGLEKKMKGRRMKLKVISVIALVSAVILCGCTPEETLVQIEGEALKKAAAGELAAAKVKVVFGIDTDDEALSGKIKRVALPFLGAGGSIEIEEGPRRGSCGGVETAEQNSGGTKMVGYFSIPVGTGEVLSRAPKSLLRLKYCPDDKSFRLVPGSAVDELNHALSAVEDGLSFEYNGGTGSGFFDDSGTTVCISGGGGVRIGVAAAKVNGKYVSAGTVSAGSEPVRINYNNMFYSDCAPVFVLGEFPAMPAERLD